MTEVRLNEILNGPITFRFDSEYYQKQFLNDEKVIEQSAHRFQKLAALELEVDGSAFYPALEPYYGLGDLPFLRVADVKGHVDFDTCVRIPDEILPSFPTLKLVEAGDIILTKGGTIARAGLVTERAAVSRDLIFINASTLSELEHTFLALYFQTKFCHRLMVRSSSISVQPHLTLTLVKELPMLITSKRFKERSLHTFKSAKEKLEQCKSLYAEAENLLLDELGLTDWRPTNENVAVKSFTASFGSTGRLDAEFYDPRHQWLEKRLRKLGAVSLASISLESPQRGVQPEFVEGGSVFVIASKAVRPSGVLFDGNECTDESFYNSPKNAKARLKKGNVLLNGTGRGTLGRASIYDADALAVADNHVTILRPNENVCDPYYLMLFLNSIAGQMQSEKWQCGTSGQLELYPNQIEQFLIYAPSMESSKLQKKVSRLIKDSFAARKRSQAILNIAKRGVEIAIEQDETTALQWMEQQSGS